MFTLISEGSFDAAHFLQGYNGKCSNIHGHRWRVVVEIYSDTLKEDTHTRGMVLDFDTLKEDIKSEVDYFDHSLIIEKSSLREKTYEALKEEGIKLIEVNFRTTAENFSKYFYEVFEKKGYQVKKVSVYETPNNCATYY
ncbi:MAG: 6-carboxytetrahydropterin synthase, partial [Lachnospiraceae bacterium]|nr:6-carboxytetrahydropterin synthase [Lachnospiraceae bacterium]